MAHFSTFAQVLSALRATAPWRLGRQSSRRVGRLDMPRRLPFPTVRWRRQRILRRPTWTDVSTAADRRCGFEADDGTDPTVREFAETSPHGHILAALRVIGGKGVVVLSNDHRTHEQGSIGPKIGPNRRCGGSRRNRKELWTRPESAVSSRTLHRPRRRSPCLRHRVRHASLAWLAASCTRGPDVSAGRPQPESRS